MIENSLSNAHGSQPKDVPTPPVIIRSKEQLIPVVSRFIELYTKLYPPRLNKSGTMNEKTDEVISDTSDPNEFQQVEDMARTIRESTQNSPEAVVLAIYQSPPTITVNVSKEPDKIEREIIVPATDQDGHPLPFTEKMAPDEDIELSNRKTVIPPKTNSQTASELNFLILACQSYLRAPLIRDDGFGSSKEDHARRRKYEAGIKGAMAYLSEGSGLPPEKNWSAAFKTKWDNIKITKNRQTAVFNNYDVVAKRMEVGKTLSLDLIDNIAPYVQGLRRAMRVARQLYDRGKTAWSSRLLTAVSRDILNHFDSQSEEAREINFQRYTYFQRDFISALHSYIYGPDATVSDTKTMVGKLDFVFKDRAYLRIFPLLQTLIQYSGRELELIASRIEALNDSEIHPNLCSKLDDVVNEAILADEPGAKPVTGTSKQEEAIKQSVIHAFRLVQAVPADNSSNVRTDIDMDALKTAKIPAVFNDSSGDKLTRALSQMAMEFYHGRLTDGSLTNRILFKHHTGEPLDLIKKAT